MNPYLAKLLGADRLEGGNIEEWSIHWTNLETAFHVLVFILVTAAACAGVWWFYKREPDYCSRQKKITLAALRSLGVFILLVILAGPVLEITKTGVDKSRVAVLVDVSKSMSRQDRYLDPKDKLIAAHVLGLKPMSETDAQTLSQQDLDALNGANRMALVQELFKNKDIDLLGRLQREYDVGLYTFARRADLTDISGQDGKKLEPTALDGLAAEGMVTEIGGSLRELAQRLNSQPLAGILLITDGANNKGEDPVLVSTDMPVRVLPIGIGVPEARDLAINYLFMESKIFIDDPAPIYVGLKNHGFPDQQCQIVVTMDNEELARKVVTLNKNGEQREVVRIKPKKAGTFTVKVEVPLLEGEIEPANNVKEREVEVIDKKVKVLVIEDDPRWEYRYLKTALTRDKRVEVNLFLRTPDRADLALGSKMYLKEFPKREDLFQYDTIVFGNTPVEAFSNEDLDNLWRFVVEEGGGIWFIAGKNAFPDTYKDTKIEHLVPVKYDRNPEVTAEQEREAPVTDGFRLMLTPDGKTHSLLRLDTGSMEGTDEDNAALWEMMPEMYWYHRALEAKEGATVLMVHGGIRGQARATGREGPAPLLVTQRVGRGRILYSAVADFWRMRYPIELGPDALARFYGHAIQYLGLAHCLGGSPRIEINTDADSYALGDRVQVTARVLSKDTYAPSTAEKVAAFAVDLDNEAKVTAFELSPEVQQPGMFKASLDTKELGRFRITLKDEEGEGEATAHKDFTVRIPQVEMDSPEMKKEVLDNIAKASAPEDSAGRARMFYADEAAAAVAELKESIKPYPQRIEDPLWDAPLMVLLFTVFMGAEWFVRKRSDLC